MTDISFYHLTYAPMEKALPRLMEKVLESGAHSVILAESEAQMQTLDTVLWTYSTLTFLPHGTRLDRYPESQPIYVTDRQENPNNASILVLAGGEVPADLGKFSRCLYMFDGNQENELMRARQQWKAFKQDGHPLTYWQQDTKGVWGKAA